MAVWAATRAKVTGGIFSIPMFMICAARSSTPRLPPLLPRCMVVGLCFNLKSKRRKLSYLTLQIYSRPYYISIIMYRYHKIHKHIYIYYIYEVMWHGCMVVHTELVPRRQQFYVAPHVTTKQCCKYTILVDIYIYIYIYIERERERERERDIHTKHAIKC